jgi:prepilin-type N-terminal cleavage/methylation domain-containing protein
MRSRRGFTLVELLITISIICVLIAILLPVLNRAKQSTAQVSCLANMRDITASCLAYAADNDSQLPWCNWGAPDGGGPPGWAYSYAGSRTAAAYPGNSDFIGGWGGLPHMPLDGVKTGVIWPYMKSLSAYHCPIDNPEFYTGTEWLTSYLCNGAE